MASRKKTPPTSQLTRTKTIAYARKHKTSGDAPSGDAVGGDDDDEDQDQDTTKEVAPTPANKLDQKFDKTELSQPIPPIRAATEETTTIGEPVPSKPPDTPAPAAAPPPPADDRTRVATVSMSPMADIGAPPDMPTMIVPATSNAGAAEEPTRMPGPAEIPTGGSPDDPAPPPGTVPPGDSRSLRRRGDRYEFALIYRQITFVITRTGLVGTRGAWRVVEYPTTAMASHAYAKECSRFVSEGFSDYRG